MSETRRHGVVGPLILIGLGVWFLLSNLGVVSWDIWRTIWRLWPLVLIAVGLDILLGRRSVWLSLAAVLVVLAIGSAAVLFILPGIGARVPASVEQINQPLQGAAEADVQIRFGAGRLSLQSGAESDQLITGTAELGPQEQISQDYRRDGDTVTYVLRSLGVGAPFVAGPNGPDNTWDLRMNPDIPARLSVDLGAGTSTVDLSRLRVHDFQLHGGVGTVTLTMPRRGQCSARINGGIGEATVIIPSGVAADIRVEGGLGGVSVDGDFQRGEDRYTSPDFLTAEDRVEMRITGGVGHVTIRRETE